MLLEGDVFDRIKHIDDESIQCIIAGPPYFHLRNYGMEDQLGLEKSFEEYLKKLQMLMVEFKRVLKPDGNCMGQYRRFIHESFKLSTRNNQKTVPRVKN